MNKNIEIIFVRHGESNGNVGVSAPDEHPDDPRLTSAGLAQAQMLAARFRHGEISSVYSSALIRACQTVQPTAQKLGKKITVLRELMEVGTGIEHTRPELALQYAPAAYDSLVQLKEQQALYNTADPSAAACEKRAAFCVKTVMAATGEGERALVCTHGAFMGYLLRYCLGITLPESFCWQVDNCALFHIRFYSDHIPKLVRANDILHLV